MFSSYHAAPFSLRVGTRSLPAVRKFNLWFMDALYRQRRTLNDLDAHMLDDIGITKAEAEAEANRPVWDVPAFWLAK